MDKVQIYNKELNLGKRVNAIKIPFVFKGKSNVEYVIKISSKFSCGCVPALKEITVKPGEEFEIHGYMSKRSTLGNMSKSGTVTVKTLNNVTLEKHKVRFQVEVIKIS